MKLLIKQRAFSWTDKYDVYDEQGNPKYFVHNEAFSLLHRIHVDDMNGNEIGIVTQNFTFAFPKFQIEIRGKQMGQIARKFSFFTPKYEIDYNGWRCEGNFLAWDYDVYEGCSKVVHISKELFHWGDTYAVTINNPKDEIMALMLVIAIDAANCSSGND